MNWKKALGFGVLIWIILFIVASVFAGYSVTTGVVMSIIMIILGAVLSYVAGRYVKPDSYADAFYYGLVFAVLGLVLDYLISSRFVAGMWSSVYYWITYLLILFAPMLTVKKGAPMQQPQ